MTDREILKLFLETEEWQQFECKRAAVQPFRLLETVVAFANTEGGYLVIGLEDPSKAHGLERLIGISENPDNVSEFLKLIEKEIDPPLRLFTHFEIKITNTKKVKDNLIVAHIKKSNDVHSLKRGDTLVRRGKQNIKIGSTEIIRLKYEKGAIKFEDEASGILSFDTLDNNLLGQYKKDTQSENLDDWQFLKDNGLAIKRNGNFEFTKAGVLLFDNNPSVTLKSKCGIKVSHYYGVKPTYSGEPNFVRRPFSIEGPLLHQIKQMLSYFREVVNNSSPKLSGGVFKPSLLIPEWAFQEAVTNAVIHRNYSVQNDIQIRFFDDRIEIESPGTYPGHITVGNIRMERFSRNPIIQRTLNRFQSAPNLDIGEGVDRMFKVMKESNLYDPLYLPSSIRPNSVFLILLNLQRVEYWDTVNKYLDENYRISNNEARRITGISDTLKMSRLLKSWVEKGLLEKVGGQAKKTAYYIKPGQEVPSALFSGGVENKT
ncbi:putative DNA binding domain-containing protein [Patescibacteria group bacterium]|nr:putative DNA binding domain-containing protein [Patescibacteria group bacterium]